MVRRSILLAVALIAASAALMTAEASAATAPAVAPVLTSAPYTEPVTVHWTPGSDPLNVSQSVYRGPGACTSPVTEGGSLATYTGNGTTEFSDHSNPADGTYCYYIKSADLLSTANSPGLSVVIDTLAPTATIGISGQVAGVVSGTVAISGTSADAVSGVAATVFHVGAVGACPSAPVVSATWDTTATPNGVYDVCNVVTDNAGHVAIATATVTVGNPLPPPPAPPAPPPAGTVTGSAADKVAPGAPRKLTVTLPRAKAVGDQPRARLHWVKPKAKDLARVVVVLNRKHGPRGLTDGSRIYRGLGTSVTLNLRPGQTGYVALFAVDASGNVSKPARRTVSLAALIPLRPISGSVVNAAPRLSWKPQAGSAYYNVQVFRNGKRVLVGWPQTAAYDVPAGALTPGTYVWFVWPAVSRDGKAPSFADLIGRATFVVKL